LLPRACSVGSRIVTIEACSGFTRVTARRIAQPPKATFVARLRPSQLPSQAARQLPDLSTINRVDSSSTDGSRLRRHGPAGLHVAPVGRHLRKRACRAISPSAAEDRVPSRPIERFEYPAADHPQPPELGAVSWMHRRMSSTPKGAPHHDGAKEPHERAPEAL
jgi:hypothetical protein